MNAITVEMTIFALDLRNKEKISNAETKNIHIRNNAP